MGRAEVGLDGREREVRTKETNLGNFVADVMRERLGADLALLNGGAIRGNRLLPEGPLTRRDLHHFLPFGNVLVPLEVSGAARPRAGGDAARRRGAPGEHSRAGGRPDSPSFLRGFPLTVVRSGC
ncbi:MAG: 5'-nucleotidase [candidate division NC10 bacterium]